MLLIGFCFIDVTERKLLEWRDLHFTPFGASYPSRKFRCVRYSCTKLKGIMDYFTTWTPDKSTRKLELIRYVVEDIGVDIKNLYQRQSGLFQISTLQDWNCFRVFKLPSIHNRQEIGEHPMSIWELQRFGCLRPPWPTMLACGAASLGWHSHRWRRWRVEAAGRTDQDQDVNENLISL